MWCNPEVPTVTLMLRRGLSLKSQSSGDNKQLWNLSQSKSQVLPHREFKWKPLKIDRLLVEVGHERCCARVRKTPKKIDDKYLPLEGKKANPRACLRQNDHLDPSHEAMEFE